MPSRVSVATRPRALQGDEEEGDAEADDQDADGGIDPDEEPEADPEQRRMGHGVTEIGHPPPDDEAAHGPGGEGDGNRGNEGADKEIVEHLMPLARAGRGGAGRGGVGIGGR